MGRAKDREAALAICIRAGYRPLPWQVRAHLATGATEEELADVDTSALPKDYGSKLKSHKAAWCGLGAGKTAWLLWELAVLVMLNPGKPGIVIAPTHDLLEQEIIPRWQEVASMLAAAGFPLSRKFGKTNKTDKLHCGGKVVFRSATKIDNLRGIEFAFGFIDESEILQNADYVWDVVSGRVRARCNVPQITLTSTPRGMRANIARFAANRRLIKDKVGACALLRNWFQVRATSEDNPYVDPGWLASCRATYSNRRWAEEIEAQILTPASQVWPEFSEVRHRIAYSYNPNLPYWMGYDGGDQYPHVLFGQTDRLGRDIIFAEICVDNLPVSHLRDVILRQVRALKRDPETIMPDRSNRREIAWLQETFPRSYVKPMESRLEQLVSEGIQTVQDQLDPYTGQAKLLFEDRLWKNIPRRGIVNCMRNYRYVQTREGEILPTPVKDNVHDHGADALRYAMVAMHSRHSKAFIAHRIHGGHRLAATA